VKRPLPEREEGDGEIATYSKDRGKEGP